jgi:hypothetical protein
MSRSDPKTIKLWHDADGYALEVPSQQLEFSARSFEKFIHLLLSGSISDATYQRVAPLLILDGDEDSYTEMTLDPVN